MRTWREAHSFALVMLLITAVAMTVTTSCGGGGSDGDSDGTLCQQCGDTDGPCRPQVVMAPERADEFPAFCADERAAGQSCTVALRCLRKLDSSQRRCFPADPATSALDLRYECDGARPNPSINPTTTPLPEPTATAEETATPESTAPTPTSVTPTATGPTPTTTATPDGGEETVAVDIDVETDDDELPASFTVTVTYPAAKGSFLADGAVDCSADIDGVTFQDAGSGTLTFTFAGDPTETIFTASCEFHQAAGQTLVDGDLAASASAGGVVVTVGEIF